MSEQVSSTQAAMLDALESWLREYPSELRITLETIAHKEAKMESEIARLRSLLQALVAAGPEAFSYDADAEEGEWAECFYCGVMLPVTEHEADCPWLLAKQYLEAPHD